MFSLTKMILYATIIPISTSDTDNYDFIQELIRVMINSIEIIFLFYLLKGKNNFSDNENGLKVVAVTVGWTLADSLCMHLFYFLMNATGEEFTWEYIQTGIIANVDLIERFGVVALVQTMFTLSSENKMNIHIIAILLGKYLFSAFGFRYIQALHFEKKWNMIGAKVSIAIIFGLFCLFIFRMNNKTDEEKAAEEYNKSKKKI